MVEEGFIVHPDKLRSMGRGRREEVTGLTVNDKTGVAREDLRAFRSLLHRLDKQGPNACTWRGTSARILARVSGYCYYLHMVDPARYLSLCDKARSLLTRYDFTPEIRNPKKRTTPPPLPKYEKEGGGLFGFVRKLFGK